MKAKEWRPLKKGDIVDVVAPASATPADAIENAKKFLISWGLVPRVPEGMYVPHFLHSNEDKERFEYLKAALLAQDSAAVWCMRGGYGSNRLLPMLAKVRKPKQNKLFIGISDITSLHVFLQQEWNWATVHGPILERLGRRAISAKHLNELRRLLFGESDKIVFENLKPLNEAARKAKSLKGTIDGGNLTTLQSAIGTPFELDLRGQFLFIEEIAERGYRVDRMLEHFSQAKLWMGCKGVLIGDFLEGDEPNGKNMVQPAIRRFAENMKIPVFAGLQAGHGEIQRPVPFGTSAQIRVGAQGIQLSIPSGAK